MRTIRPTQSLLAAGFVGAALAIAACGEDSSAGGTSAADPPETVSTKGLPKPLADNVSQASELIDGGSEALEAKLEDLRGHPVVVNQWGSWCPPCRAEFPIFAESAEAHLDEVAFVGVDIEDDRADAEEFLAEFPVPYPSIFDPDSDAVRSLDWAGFSPTTWFIDERGEIEFVRNGAYPDQGTLEAHINNYLIKREG